jgi:hypothetical protein
MAAPRQNPRKAGAKRAAGGRRARRGTVATIVMMVFALLAITALPLCVILLTGLIPTMVSVLTDRYHARYLTRTVGAMNLAGIAPLALQLWTHRFGIDEAMALLSNPVSWLMMYGAAALGWALFFAMPSLARVVVDLRADQQQTELKARARQLVAEWGEDVTGRGRSG